jgi:hypothetical protein
MTIRFNNGNGGVTCNICNVLFVSSFADSEDLEYWRLKADHLCQECEINEAIGGNMDE